MEVYILYRYVDCMCVYGDGIAALHVEQFVKVLLVLLFVAREGSK